MGLSLGDILAIVLGSILFLLLFGYLLHILVFKNRSSNNITLEQIDEYLTKNPNCRTKITDLINRLEKDDIGNIYDDGMKEVASQDIGRPNTENYQETREKQERLGEVYDDRILDQVERSMDTNRMPTTPVR